MILLVQISSAQTGEQADEAAGTGTIRGKITTRQGRTLSGGQISFYRAGEGLPPDSDKYERVPDYVRSLDNDGRFSVDLPEGSYYVRAVKRISGDLLGPPRQGDLIYRSVDEKMLPKEYRIEAGKVLDMGTIAGAVVMERKQTMKRVVSTAIKGRIVDTKGKPMPRLVVVAFLEPIAQSKPVFTSESTGKDGKYVLRLVPGTYYLRARNAASKGGPPKKGAIVGYYGKEEPFPVTVKEGGVVKGINFGVLAFPGRGPEDRNSLPEDRKFRPKGNKKQKQPKPMPGAVNN